MHRRTRAALAVGALLLAAPAITSCGFDAPTDRINTNGAGSTNRDGDIDLVGAVIVASRPNAGTLIATLVNGTDEEVSFRALSGEGLTAAPFEALDIAAKRSINLAEGAREGAGVTLTGDFEAGEFVTVALGFSSGETVTHEIPVVPPCYEYEGLDTQPGDEEAAEGLQPEVEPFACDLGGAEGGEEAH